jgi:hypothetical protein
MAMNLTETLETLFAVFSAMAATRAAWEAVGRMLDPVEADELIRRIERGM